MMDGFHTVLLLLLAHLCAGQAQDSGPRQSVTVMVGGGAVLPCQLEAPADASQVTMEWARPDLQPRFVYVWHEGQELLDDQNRAYQGRASVSVDGMKLGDISLRLSDVRSSDNGRYRCYTPKQNEEVFVDLLVGAASAPAVSLAGLDAASSGVVLQCESAGWYPEPELSWLDSEGQLLPAGPTETHTGPDGLYAVSSRRTVKEKHGHSFTCRVQQRDTNQSRDALIQVPEDFFVAPSSCAAPVALSVLFGLMFMLTVAVFSWWWRCRRTKLQENGPVTKEQISLMMEKKEAERLTEELKRTAQVIDTLQGIMTDLKDQTEQIRQQTKEAEREAEEADRKLRSTDEEVEEAPGDKTAEKVKGFTALRETLKEACWNLQKKKKEHQQLELSTEKLLATIQERVTALTEKKAELETRRDDLRRDMEAMKK